MTTLVNDTHGQTEQHVVALVPPPELTSGSAGSG
jgi:hypothetical protein